MSVYEEARLPTAGEQPLPAPHLRLRGVSQRPRQLSLRLTLLALLVGLLVATVVSISLVQWVTTARSIEQIESKSFRMLVLTLSSQVQSFLELGTLALQEARERAQHGRL